MKKFITIGIVFIMSLLIVNANIATQPTYDFNVLDNDSYVIYTVGRPGRFIARNMQTGEFNVLFEIQIPPGDFRVVGDYIFVRSGGIHRFDMRGNGELIIEGSIFVFDVDENYIYYAVGTSPFTPTRIMRSDLNGNNITMLAEERMVNKLTAVNNGVIYSDSVSGVGKISNNNHVTLVENFRGLFATGGIIPNAGTHFVINDKIIITGYPEPEGFEEYWYSPTIILDLDGNVISIWENTFVRNIGESNDRIYAQIDMLEAEVSEFIYRISILSSHFYYISNGFSEKRRVMDDVPNSRDMYVSGNNVYFLVNSNWTRWDIMPDSTLENRVDLGSHMEQYPDEILVILHDRSIIQEFEGRTPVPPFRERFLIFDTPPIIENSRTLVPFRAIFEALDMDVDWNDESRTAIGTSDDVTIELPIDSTTATVNGAAVTLDVPAMLYNARTMVPLRFIAESTGADVDWCEATRTVTISIN